MVEYGKGRKLGLVTLAVAMACALAACGGGGDSSTVPASTDTTATDNANLSSSTTSPNSQVSTLTLSGSPATTAAPGTTYSFVPTLEPAATATFSISNKPAWAMFSVATGELSGVPGVGDVGTFANIVITATTMTNGSATLPGFAIKVAQSQVATAGSATLSWVPPTQNTDGSTVSNLGGYNIYYGGSTNELTNKIQVTNPGLTAYTVSGLGAGTHVFGITAYTAAGTESDVAIVGSKTIM